MLNNELSNYVSLTETMTRYMKLYSEKVTCDLKVNNDYVENSIKEIESIEDKSQALNLLKKVEDTYSVLNKFTDIDLFTMNLAMEGYINAIDRKFKNWANFCLKFSGKIAGTAVDAVPGISEIKNLCQNVIDMAELMNEYEDDATDYSELDKRLLEIEEHILVMQLSRLLMEESIRILENQKQ